MPPRHGPADRLASAFFPAPRPRHAHAAVRPPHLRDAVEPAASRATPFRSSLLPAPPLFFFHPMRLPHAILRSSPPAPSFALVFLFVAFRAFCRFAPLAGSGRHAPASSSAAALPSHPIFPSAATLPNRAHSARCRRRCGASALPPLLCHHLSVFRKRAGMSTRLRRPTRPGAARRGAATAPRVAPLSRHLFVPLCVSPPFARPVVPFCGRAPLIRRVAPSVGARESEGKVRGKGSGGGKSGGEEWWGRGS